MMSKLTDISFCSKCFGIKQLSFTSLLDRKIVTFSLRLLQLNNTTLKLFLNSRTELSQWKRCLCHVDQQNTFSWTSCPFIEYYIISFRPWFALTMVAFICIHSYQTKYKLSFSSGNISRRFRSRNWLFILQ